MLARRFRLFRRLKKSPIRVLRPQARSSLAKLQASFLRSTSSRKSVQQGTKVLQKTPQEAQKPNSSGTQRSRSPHLPLAFP